MSDSTARAVVLGIAALYDIADEAHEGPVKPSLTLRALLALIYEASRRERKPYDDFWKAVIHPGLESYGKVMQDYIRHHHALDKIADIARTFRMQPGSREYREFIESLRHNQRLVVDPEYRARMGVMKRLQQIKHVPRGMTLEEAARFRELGWTERKR